MITIESNIDHNTVYYKHFFFGGGEQHIQLNGERLHVVNSVTITLPFMQDSEIVKLALIVDALRRAGCKSMSLKIP
jgi:hypothetical protein